MAGVSASIDLRINATLRGAAHAGQSPQFLAHIEKLLEFSAGTAAITQTDRMYFETRTLAASGSEDLDLAGVLSDPLGGAITAAELVMLYIGAAPANTNDVQLTRPATNGVPMFLAAGDGLSIGPSDFFLWSNRKGITVTPATGDLIHIANSAGGTGVDYTVLALARSVAA